MLRGKEKNLNVVWRTKDAESKIPNMSLLDADSLYEQCVAEENTLSSLESTDSCYKCGGEDTGKCIDAYSLVLMARLHLVDNDSSQFQHNTPSDALSCDTLRSSWTSDVQEQFTTSLKACVNLSILMSSDNANMTEAIIDSKLSCPFPFKFLTTMVDESFAASDPPIVRYSSSYYATKNSKSNVEGMYTANENGVFDKADGNPLLGVYDTTDEDFYDYYSDSIVGRDMALAVGSAGVTIIAMVVHTKIPWLTLMGLFQILLSFPLGKLKSSYQQCICFVCTSPNMSSSPLSSQHTLCTISLGGLYSFPSSTLLEYLWCLLWVRIYDAFDKQVPSLYSRLISLSFTFHQQVRTMYSWLSIR